MKEDKVLNRVLNCVKEINRLDPLDPFRVKPASHALLPSHFRMTS